MFIKIKYYENTYPAGIIYHFLYVPSYAQKEKPLFSEKLMKVTNLQPVVALKSHIL